MTTAEFWDRVDVPAADAAFETCWLWRGPGGVVSKGGHVRVSYRSKKVYVHRLAWLFAIGDPGPLIVRHYVCNTPACTFPGHLAAFPGGALANARDREAAGARTPLLPRGHGRDEPGAHWSAKLTVADVLRIRAGHADGLSLGQLAGELKVSPATVRSVLLGRTYQACGVPVVPASGGLLVTGMANAPEERLWSGGPRTP